MRKIFNYTQFRMVTEEFTRDLHTGNQLRITLEAGFALTQYKTANLVVEMVELGCSLDRRNIYYKFVVLESDNLKDFSIGSELIFPIDFEGQDFTFICNYAEVNRFSKMLLHTERHYRASVKSTPI